MSRHLSPVLASLTGFLLGVGGVGSAQQPNPTQLTAVVKAPTKVRLDWTSVAGSKGYWVQRALGGGNFVSIIPDRTAGTWYADHDATAGTTFRYRIKSVNQSGPATFSPIVTVTTPGVPAGATSVPSSPLSTPLNGVPLPLEPVQLAAPPPAMTAVPQPAPAGSAAPTAVATGRYRIVANGFRVLHETSDDVLSRDGKWDEVYGAFEMFHYDRKTGSLLDHGLKSTKVLGELGFPNRIRAGTASGGGGLRSGDQYPIGNPAARLPGMEPTDTTFPFLVWQGTLTEGTDAVVILPTMWEWDNNPGPFRDWSALELGQAPEIWWNTTVQQTVTSAALGVIVPPGSTTPGLGPVITAEAVWVALLAPGGANLLAGLLVGSQDRPIGIGPSTFPRRAIVLTREIIEKALNGPMVMPDPAAIGPENAWLMPYLIVPQGVIPVLLKDGTIPNLELLGNYLLYLQVERV